MHETVDLEEFADLMRWFIACHHNGCNSCEYEDRCKTDDHSMSTQIVAMFNKLLPYVEDKQTMVITDFLDLIGGNNADI